MGLEECKKFLVENLEKKLDKIEVIVDRIKQKTIQIRSDTRQRAVELFKKILNRPDAEIEADEVQKEYSSEVISLLEDVQYAQKRNEHYVLGSVAERDLMRGYCPGRAIVR